MPHPHTRLMPMTTGGIKLEVRFHHKQTNQGLSQQDGRTLELSHALHKEGPRFEPQGPHTWHLNQRRDRPLLYLMNEIELSFAVSSCHP